MTTITSHRDRVCAKPARSAAPTPTTESHRDDFRASGFSHFDRAISGTVIHDHDMVGETRRRHALDHFPIF